MASPSQASTFTSEPSALEHLQAGRLQAAEARCRQDLRNRPGDPDSLHLLGRVLLSSGRALYAVPVLEQAVMASGDPNLLVTLGTALYEAGEVVSALEPLERAVRAAPLDADAHLWLGVALLDLDRPAEAREALWAAARLEPDRANPLFWLANALLVLGDGQAAGETYRRALELEPAAGQLHCTLGNRLVATAQLDRAHRMFGWGLTLNPENPELRHMVAAIRGHAPLRASDEYVKTYFDRFADTFDRVLVDRLHYRVPDLIVDAALAALPPTRRRDLDVLDAGCGTGLCGRSLRPVAQRLVGVDLSTEMLARAGARGDYDDLIADEITSALSRGIGTFDLIVAADVLVYFGDLSALVRAIAGALKPGGVAAVSVERADGDSYAIRPTGRYAHSLSHIRASAAAASLEVVATYDCEGRLEDRDPVAGHIAVLSFP